MERETRLEKGILIHIYFNFHAALLLNHFSYATHEAYEDWRVSDSKQFYFISLLISAAQYISTFIKCKHKLAFDNTTNKT